MLDHPFLLVAAFFAGFIDAVVGGGGLIQVPALFASLPQTMPATLFGTNKLASIWGTGTAAWRYSRHVRIEWGAALPAAGAAFLFAMAGAYSVTRVSPDLVRKALPLLLTLLALYTFRAKDFGLRHAPIRRGMQEGVAGLTVGAGIGFYDGFFGPGTGSFLIFLFVHFFGYDFLGASAASKVVNVACNLAALAWFGYSGHVVWQLGVLMATCNVLGALAGSRVALQHGSALIRKVFLVVVLGLIAKTARDAFFL